MKTGFELLRNQIDDRFLFWYPIARGDSVLAETPKDDATVAARVMKDGSKPNSSTAVYLSKASIKTAKEQGLGSD
jgi:hypothetical protein